MSAKALSHEEFQVAPLKSGRLKVIRQDRIALPVGALQINVGDNRFNVTNMSSSGVAFQVPAEQSSEFELKNNLNFSLQTILVHYENLAGEIVRVDKQEDFVEFGLQFDSFLLDTEKIELDMLATSIFDSSMGLVKESSEVPEVIRAEVGLVKTFFLNLKKSISSDVNIVYDSAIKTREYTDFFCEIMSRKIADVSEEFYQKLMSSIAGLSEQQKVRVNNFVRTELGELVFGAPFASRAFNKPLGYAGDFGMMLHLYNDESIGKTLFDKVMHRYFIEEPAARAVKNRGRYLSKKIIEALKSGEEQRFLSVASGPAMEMQMVLESCERGSLKEVTFCLIDQDELSLKHAQRSLHEIELRRKTGVKFEFTNIAIKNVLARGVPNGQYNMVYSAGLFDYFSDPIAREAAIKFHGSLVNGGSAIIGNFSDQNPTQTLMEVLLDWHLIHRSPAQMTKIFDKIGSSVRIEQEELGINLFAVIEK